MAHYLPKIKADSKMRQVDTHGVWSKDDSGDLLTYLPDDLDVDQRPSSDDDYLTNSLPTPFARAKLMELALREDINQNPDLVNRLVGEWRGVYAILILAKMMDYELIVRPFILDDVIHAIANNRRHAGYKKFLETMRNLDPSVDQHNWDRNDLIYLKYELFGRIAYTLIGSYSPDTVILAPAEYSIPNGIIPWTRPDGTLKDPTSFLQQPAQLDYKNALSVWLDNMPEEINKIANNSLANLLNAQIENWKRDLVGAEQGSHPITVQGLTIDNTGMFDGEFQYLTKQISYDIAQRFANALIDSRHTDHLKVRDIWRGILGIFALQDYYDLKVVTEEIDLNGFNQDNYLEEGKPPQFLPFVQEMKRSKATTAWIFSIKNPERNFEKCYFAITDDRVFMGAPFDLRVNCELVPWIKDGKISDPISYFGNQQSGCTIPLQLMEVWIKNSINELNQVDNATMTKPVIDELESWKSEISNELKNNQQETLAKPDETYINYVKGRHSTVKRHYEILTRPIDFELKRFIDNQYDRQGLSTIIFRDWFENIVANNPDQVVEWGYRADQLVYKPNSNSIQLKSGLNIPLKIIDAKRLFTPVVARVALSESDHVVRQQGAMEYLLPVDLRIFKYYTLKQLKGEDPGITIKMEQIEGTNTKWLECQMTVETVTGEKRTELKKYFENDIIDLPGDAVFAMWPDFQAEDWDQYKIYHFIDEEQESRNTFKWNAFAVDQNSTVEILSHEDQYISENKYEMSDDRDGTPKHYVERHEIRDFSTPIDGLIVTHVFDDGSVARENYAGMILLHRHIKKSTPRNRNKWIVGIDIGTSNTHIARRIKFPDNTSQNPEHLVLSNRLVPITMSATKPTNQTRISMYFANSQMVVPPFPTGFKEVVDNLDRNKLGYGTHFMWEQVDLMDKSHLEFFSANIKWDKDSASYRNMFRMLVLLVLAEAKANQDVSSVEFRWSYPLTLPEATTNDLRYFWQALLGDANPRFARIRSSLDVKANDSNESMALYRCLARDEGGLLKGGENPTIAIDIGGGSSDIAYWEHDSPTSFGSLMLGGNDIFNRLFDKPGWDFIRRILQVRGFKQHSIDSVLDLTKNTGTNKPRLLSILNMLLHGDKYKKTGDGDIPNLRAAEELLTKIKSELYFKGNLDSTPWLEIRTLVYLMATGLLYYTGIVVGAKEYQNNKRELVNAITTYFGGKASYLLYWTYQFDEHYTNSLRHAVRCGYYNAWHKLGLAIPDSSNGLQDTKIYLGIKGGPMHSSIDGMPFQKRGVNDLDVQPKDEIVYGLTFMKEKDFAQHKTVVNSIVGGEITDATDGAFTDEITVNDVRHRQVAMNYSESFISDFVDKVLKQRSAGNSENLLLQDFKFDTENLKKIDFANPQFVERYNYLLANYHAEVLDMKLSADTRISYFMMELKALMEFYIESC